MIKITINQICERCKTSQIQTYISLDALLAFLRLTWPTCKCGTRLHLAPHIKHLVAKE